MKFSLLLLMLPPVGNCAPFLFKRHSFALQNVHHLHEITVKISCASFKVLVTSDIPDCINFWRKGQTCGEKVRTCRVFLMRFIPLLPDYGQESNSTIYYVRNVLAV